VDFSGLDELNKLLERLRQEVFVAKEEYERALRGEKDARRRAEEEWERRRVALEGELARERDSCRVKCVVM
jgi:hypothetical protein